MNLPRPVAVQTREAHLATLRAWHEATFNPRAKRGDVDYRPGPDWPPSLNELAAMREREVIVAQADGQLVTVDPAPGEVVEP